MVLKSKGGKKYRLFEEGKTDLREKQNKTTLEMQPSKSPVSSKIARKNAHTPSPSVNSRKVSKRGLRKKH